MNKNEEISKQIQDLLKHISILKETRDSFSKEYKDLSKNFIPIKYKEKSFLDKIFTKRYQKILTHYEHSKQQEQELTELDDNILQLQIEIENLECLLYSLQKQFSNKYADGSITTNLMSNLEDIEFYNQ